MNARQLAALARKLDLGPNLLLGRGEEQQAGRDKPSLLADALEAVLAAVFLDGGLKAAAGLTQRLFSPHLESTGHPCLAGLQNLAAGVHPGPVQDLAHV